MARPFATAVLLALLPHASAAQGAAVGLYAPFGAEWSCTEDGLGLPGGALGIVNRQIFEPGRVCDLSGPPPGDGPTAYRALCAAEGREWVEEVELRVVPSGLEVRRGDGVVRWARCPTPVDARANDPWKRVEQGLGWRVRTRDAYGNAVEVRCQPPGRVETRLRLEGAPMAEGPGLVRIDGAARAVAVGRGGTVDAPGLPVALADGEVLRVEAADGRAASFHLRGSHRALAGGACTGG